MRNYLRVIAAMCMLTLLTACSGGSEPSADESTIAASTTSPAPQAKALEDLTVGLTYIPDIQFAPFYLADKYGYFTDEGLNVTLRHHGQGESLFGALASGDEDVVNAGADEMVQARSQGIDVAAFGQLYQTYPVVLIVPEDSDIRTLDDLRGKTIGVPGPFGENWFALLAILQQAHLTEADVNIEHIGFTTQAALVTNKVDAVMGFTNNDVVNFRASDLPVRTFALETNALQSIAIGAMDETIAERGEALAGLRTALARAVRDIQRDPKAAVDDCFDYLPKVSGANKIAQAEAVLTATAKLYGDEALAIDASQWPAMVEFMAGAELLDGEVDPVQAVNDLSELSASR
ncbi:MAG: ABC transporter substrate-binding protein [Bowdeniella nasicola]|nr:ABC transporter substrate-binding protein [Bowdeniella nasicola]